MKSKFKKTIPIILVVFLAISIVFSVMVGPVEIDFMTAGAIILNQIGIQLPNTWSSSEESIIINVRLPRVLMAVTVGAMLGVAGVAAQGLFKNPIADPYIIGISSASSFGAALIIVLGITLLTFFTIPLVSFLFAMLAITIIYELSKTQLKLSIGSLLLAGIGLSFFFSALTSFILFFSEDKSHYILSFLMGSFWGANWIEFYVVLAVMIPGTILLFFYGRDLNAMVFGDDVALSLGINVEQSKRLILFLMVILSSTAVAFCGTIGFVGLIIPHIMRLIFGSDNRKLVPLSAIAGGLLLLWADILARLVMAPRELPVGIFTALMGGPFFIYLIIKKKQSREIS